MYFYPGHPVQTNSSYSKLHLKQNPPHTSDIIIYVTTLPHRGRVGPPPPKRVATTLSTATTHPPAHKTSSSTSPPFPTGGEWDHPPLRGWPRRPTHATTKETKPPNPPPVGKAGFEVWVLTKGGLVSVHHCRLYRTVVHAHHLGRYAEPSGACVYRYGPVTKSKLS